MGQIVYWDRYQNRDCIEQVYGDRAMKLVYGGPVFQGFTHHVLARSWISQLVGAYHSSGLSKKKIDPFIQDFKIPMEEYDEGPFQSFNDFFIRKFKEGKRPFCGGASEMPAFSEARYFAFSKVTPETQFPVKGELMGAEAVLGDRQKAEPFIGGPALLARLCPTDYHRFHYPDDGRKLESYRVGGRLHSVNPFALERRPDILSTNEREVSILDTKNFGRLAYVEIGALCVGKIVQTHRKESFQRGDEKGYFLFGGSTVLLFGEKGKWTPDEDLLQNTRDKKETWIRLGDRVATRQA